MSYVIAVVVFLIVVVAISLLVAGWFYFKRCKCNLSYHGVSLQHDHCEYGSQGESIIGNDKGSASVSLMDLSTILV